MKSAKLEMPIGASKITAKRGADFEFRRNEESAVIFYPRLAFLASTGHNGAQELERARVTRNSACLLVTW